jgi:hypothetical protein
LTVVERAATVFEIYLVPAWMGDMTKASSQGQGGARRHSW